MRLAATRILVAEDDPIQALELNLLLENAGAEVIGPAETAGGALALAKAADLTLRCPRCITSRDRTRLNVPSTLSPPDSWKRCTISVAAAPFNQAPCQAHQKEARFKVPLTTQPASSGQMTHAPLAAALAAPRR